MSAADAGDRPGLRDVAGIAAAWFFGNNPADEAMYDPATGRTYDGIEGDGRVNRNSGAESTIHGLLTMLILDREAEIAAAAMVTDVVERRTWTLVEAESGTLGSDATLYQPPGAWTGESLWSGGAGVQLRPGGTLTIPVAGTGPNLLLPVVLLDPSAGTTTWTTTPRHLTGVIRHARVGPQGESPAPGLLAVETVPRTVGDVESVMVRGAGATRSSMLCWCNPRSSTSYWRANRTPPRCSAASLGIHSGSRSVCRWGQPRRSRATTRRADW